MIISLYIKKATTLTELAIALPPSITIIISKSEAENVSLLIAAQESL